MSSEPSQKFSLSQYFLDAVAGFHERHEEWFDRHPRVDATMAITTYGMMVGYNLLRLPDRALRGAWFWKTTPLEKFEPKHDGQFETKPQPPHWQDLVFGDGRAEKLIARLESLPQVKGHVQKLCLFNSSGGLGVLPAHRQLVRHGLNDNEIGHVMYNLSRTVNNYVHHKDSYESKAGLTIDFERDVSLIADAAGICTATPSGTKIITQGADHQYSQMGLTHLIDAYRASGHDDPSAIRTANAISAAVYGWIIEDVLPSIPNLFPASYTPGYTATHQDDGSFRMERQPQGYDVKEHARDITDFMERQSPANRKTLYEILVDGYTGTIPAAQQAPAAPAPGPRPA